MNHKPIIINPYMIIVYFVLIPFLNPRGFYDVVPGYKTVMTLWMCLAFVVILIELFQNLYGFFEINAMLLMFVCYFLCLALITFVVQSGFGEGLQSIFATPMLCLYAYLRLKKDGIQFVSCMSNILILLFILDLTIFNPYIMQNKIASYHIIFIGHIQVAAQFGLLGILCGYMFYRSAKKRGILLIVLSMIVMMTSGASSALLICVLLILALCFNKLKLHGFLCKNAQIYASILCVIGLAFVFINVKLPDKIIGLLNSRQSIWAVAMEQFKQAPILGYGVQGTVLKLYWGGEFNYAHSQFAQNLLDGGIILSIVFLILIFMVGCKINRLDHINDRIIANLTFIGFLVIGVFDSLSFYPYFMCVLVMILFLGKYRESSYEL